MPRDALLSLGVVGASTGPNGEARGLLESWVVNTKHRHEGRFGCLFSPHTKGETQKVPQRVTL